MSPTRDGHARPASGLQHSSFGDGGKTGGGVPFDPPSPIRVCRGGRKFFERLGGPQEVRNFAT